MVRKNLRHFLQRAERNKEKRRRGILSVVRSQVPSFVSQFQAVKKVGMIGSVPRKEFFSERSDVDIVVEGLPKKDYFKAYLFWEKRLPVSVDLIRGEDIRRDRIKDQKILYEKD